MYQLVRRNSYDNTRYIYDSVFESMQEVCTFIIYKEISLGIDETLTIEVISCINLLLQ